MARPTPNRAYERQPQHFGAAPYAYRYGSAAGSAKNPPFWEPEFVHDPQCQYYADQYAKDVREGFVATEVAEVRQGQLVIFALGGAARRLFDSLQTVEGQYGVDFPDGQGAHSHHGCRVHPSSVGGLFPCAWGSRHVAYRT